MLNNEFLELRDDLLAASDLTSINQRLQRSLEQYGFDSFVYGYAILPEDPFNSPAGVVFHATTDPELMAVHYEAGGISNDPVAARVFQLKEPELFDIPAVIGDRESKFYRHLMLDAAVDCGIELGALCPIKGKTGAGSLMAWTKNGSRKECRKLVEEKKDTLIPSLAGLYHEALNSTRVLSSSFSLTPAELDALQYVAHGLTASDISDKLKVGERAIEKRLERARRKLGAVNTTNAVYRAAVFNLI